MIMDQKPDRPPTSPDATHSKRRGAEHEQATVVTAELTPVVAEGDHLASLLGLSQVGVGVGEVVVSASWAKNVSTVPSHTSACANSSIE